MGEAESHEPAPSVHGSNSCFVSTLSTFSCKGSSGICYSTQRSPILLTLPTFWLQKYTSASFDSPGIPNQPS
ncbi:hypothetical protein AB3S75_007402 [Citrus x aurantiifolia]